MIEFLACCKTLLIIFIIMLISLALYKIWGGR